jgi:quinol monooxygenase YgiN
MIIIEVWNVQESDELEGVVMPYIHLARCSVPSNQLTWMAWARLFLSAASRSEGLWSARLLRERGDEPMFLFVTVWQSQEDFDRAMSTPDVRLAKTALEDAATPHRRQLELVDHVWGRGGSDNFLTPGTGFLQLCFVHVPLANLAAWTPYVRNCASVMARQNGVTSYEVARDLSDPEVFYVLRSYESESWSAIMPGAETPWKPSKEIEYATRPATELGLYEGARPAVHTDCVLIDGTLGVGARALYTQFMKDLNSV